MFGIGTSITNLGMAGGMADAADGVLLAEKLLPVTEPGLAISGIDSSIAIRDTGTPANAFAGDVNGKLTYTGPSEKWILGANGIYQSGTTLRTEYDVSGAPIGIPIESQRTQLCRWSDDETLATSRWAASGASPPSISQVATSLITGSPVNGLEITFPSGSLSSVASGATATNWGGFSKTTDTTTKHSAAIWLSLSRPLTGSERIEWLITGASGANSLFALTAATASPTSLLRRSLDGFLFTAAVTGGFGFYMRVSPVSGQELTSPCTVRVFRPSCEVGDKATSYISNTGSGSVTRAADRVSLATNLFPQGAAGILAVKFRLASVASGQAYAAQLYETSGGNQMSIGRNTAGGGAGEYDFYVQKTGADQAWLRSATAAANTDVRLAASYAVNDMALSVNGSAVQTDTSGTPPTPGQLYIGGSNFGTNQIDGHLIGLLHLPRNRASNAELQGLLA